MKTLQKIARLANYLIGVLLYVGVVAVLSSFENKVTHPAVNDFMINAFLSDYSLGSISSDKKFEKYLFTFDQELTGTAVSQTGLLAISESDKKQSVREWIKHGGMSADEPEVPASFRHFYDPTAPEGSRYLRDVTQATLLSWLQAIGYAYSGDPRTDGIEWALGDRKGLKDEHKYCWENGKDWMKKALETADEAQRERLMVQAWRAMGETLHMIADHGVPVHVRDDSHPAPFANKTPFGDPDPYEEYMYVLSKDYPAKFSDFSKGKYNDNLVKGFKAATTVRDIAHQTALYTNTNFFTNQTIAGVDWQGATVVPVTHSERTYSLPKLTTDSYDILDHGYTINGVLQCTDRSYWLNFVGKHTYPYIDEACVEAQASVIVPNLAQAGKHAMRLFIPALTIEIEKFLEDGTIKGTVKHLTDTEYATEIKYNGPVTIKDRGSNDLEIIQCKDGQFEGKVTKKTAYSEYVTARISFGGLNVSSKEQKMGIAFDFSKVDSMLIYIDAPSKIDVTTSAPNKPTTTEVQSEEIVFGNRFGKSVKTIPFTALTSASISATGVSYAYSVTDPPKYSGNIYGGDYKSASASVNFQAVINPTTLQLSSVVYSLVYKKETRLVDRNPTTGTETTIWTTVNLTEHGFELLPISAQNLIIDDTGTKTIWASYSVGGKEASTLFKNLRYVISNKTDGYGQVREFNKFDSTYEGLGYPSITIIFYAPKPPKAM